MVGSALRGLRVQAVPLTWAALRAQGALEEQGALERQGALAELPVFGVLLVLLLAV